LSHNDSTDLTRWLTEGLGNTDAVYCLTVLRDVDQDEALRRMGATDEELSTDTWSGLLKRAKAELARFCADSGEPVYVTATRYSVVAAFGLGRHTLLVEDNGWAGTANTPWSAGTLAVSTYRSVNSDVAFLVSRDGVFLAGLDENAPGSAFGADPEVLRQPLADMGITDPVEFDEDPGNYHALDDIELLCRIGGIRPTVADMLAPARVAIFRKAEQG
jgi:hypothetical protein